jgi:ABC-2 type transport system ATP-binding protein
MADDTAILVENVCKTFKLPHEKHTSVKGLLINTLRRGKRTYERQEVLKNVSFEIKKGEFFGIVGRNGSGKSTLLKLLAQIYIPNKGTVTVNGKLTPFIELGVGFNPELTGRENVYLNGALLGFNRKEMDGMYDNIVSFAELERFMDQKLKNYSSGMQVRLAFSIAIRVEGGILLLDEVLAVGDATFQKKCYDYFKQLKKEKRTVVFVSHDTGALLEYCTSGILIEEGKIVKRGAIDGIVHEYIDIINRAEQREGTVAGVKKRWGTGEVIVESLKMHKSDTRLKTYKEGERIEFSVTFTAKQSSSRPVYGITISDLAGLVVFQSNTLWCRVPTADIKTGQSIVVRWSIPNAFNSGTYVISPAVSDASGTVVYDWREDLAKFEVFKRQKSHGPVNVEHELKIE